MEDITRIEEARRKRDEAAAEFRAVVLDVATRASLRETAKAARVRPNTITDWKKQATE
jgi:hypothetical protein